MNRTLSTLNSGLIWAGAGISASAIVVGTWIAPLGWQQGLLAIVLGHLLGGILFFAAGLIGAKTGKMRCKRCKFPLAEARCFSPLPMCYSLLVGQPL